MAKSRRLTGFLQALKERRPQSLQSLPAMSKRLTVGLKSVLTRNTDERGSSIPDLEVTTKGNPEAAGTPLSLARTVVDDHAAGASRDPKADHEAALDRPDAHSTTAQKGPEKRKYPGEHDDPLLWDRYCDAIGFVPPPSDLSRKPSTKKQQEIIDWVNQQPAPGKLSAQDADETGSSGLGDGGPHVTFSITNKSEASSTSHSQTCCPPSGRTSPRKSHHNKVSQNPKDRVIRESQQDQFTPPSRQETFESQHRGIYAFQIPSTTSFADQFSLSRRDSEATVGTTVSGTVSDATTNKRFSASTVATTLTMAASSDTLHGQFKRLRPDSRSSSYRSGSIPSARSSAYASNPHALRHKSLPAVPRDTASDLDEHHPPVPAIPRQSLPNSGGTDLPVLSLPPRSVLEAGALAQRRRGRYAESRSGAITSAGSASLDELRACLPAETGDDILSVINEHASDAGSTMLASPRPSVDHRPESHEFLVDNLGSRQSSEGPSIFSRETSPLESNTSATSLGELLEFNRPSEDNSDVEDTMSDITDHTDHSLIGAFEASPTPFDPALLSVLISLKEEVVDRIKQRLQTIMLQAHGPQQPPTQPDTSASSQAVRPAGSTGQINSLGVLPTLRKRPSDEEDDGTSGRGNGDDGDGRKRQNTTTRAELEERLWKFACPFHKRYPGHNQLWKSCKAPGWSSVHRVKEHIYRRHQSPAFRCTRCLETFESEEELTEHSRADVRCRIKIAPPDEVTIYISKSQEMQLRKKKREKSEEERWFNIFNVLFPGIPANQRPSPYHESSLQVPSPDPAILDHFRAFLLEELPTRINSQVNSHLLIQPPGFTISLDMTEVIRSTMQEVMEDFRPVLVAPGSPDENDGEHASLINITPQGQPETTTGAQVFHTSPSSRAIFPPPLRAAPPPPLPRPTVTWGAVPLSDSPSASIFDFGFGNPEQGVAGAPAVIYNAVQDVMGESWGVVDRGYDNGVAPTFEELLGTGLADDTHP